METTPLTAQNIVVRAEKPTQEQVLKKFYDKTCKKAFPADARMWAFISSKLSYSEPISDQAKGLLSVYFNNTVSERDLRSSVKPKTPIINPASTFTYTLRIDGEFNNETFTQTFTLGGPGQKVEYLTFGREGSVQVPFTQEMKGMFLCLHPNNADSPLYWSEERKKKHGIYVENVYPTIQLFRNGWSAGVDVSRPDIDTQEMAREGVMSTLYSLPEAQFEAACSAILGTPYKSVGFDSNRRTRLGAMVNKMLPTNLRAAASAMTGSFLNIQNYVSKAEEVGIIRYDTESSIWTLRGSDNEADANFSSHSHIPGTEVATGTAWSDDPLIYLVRLIDGQIDLAPRPSVFMQIRTRVDALSKEFKSMRREAEQASDPNWMPDDEFTKLVNSAIETGVLIVTKNAVSWGDAQVDAQGQAEPPVCKLQNGQPALEKLLKLKTDERTAIVIRVLKR